MIENWKWFFEKNFEFIYGQSKGVKLELKYLTSLYLLMKKLILHWDNIEYHWYMLLGGQCLIIY